MVVKVSYCTLEETRELVSSFSGGRGRTGDRGGVMDRYTAPGGS